MHLKDIISTLMLSDLYFSLPLGERKQVVLRLWALYGGTELPIAPGWCGSRTFAAPRAGGTWPKA